VKGARSGEDRIRRLLLGAAVLVTVLALTHHADHVIRGELVSDHGLDVRWNHSGWPFRPSVTPFTFSLAVYAILLPGIVLTLRRRVWAGYWIVASIVLAAVIVVVHFLPGPRTETPRVIYESYERSSGRALAGALAVADVLVIVVALGALFLLAVRARRISGRW
jgi:hypothetical protein